jgi:hypothetical protein
MHEQVQCSAGVLLTCQTCPTLWRTYIENTEAACISRRLERDEANKQGGWLADAIGGESTDWCYNCGQEGHTGSVSDGVSQSSLDDGSDYAGLRAAEAPPDAHADGGSAWGVERGSRGRAGWGRAKPQGQAQGPKSQTA